MGLENKDLHTVPALEDSFMHEEEWPKLALGNTRGDYTGEDHLTGSLGMYPASCGVR